MKWEYETTACYEKIRLLQKGRAIGSFWVQRSANDKIVPKETIVFVRTDLIKQEDFYQAVSSAPGIKDDDRQDLEAIVRKLQPIKSLDKVEPEPAYQEISSVLETVDDGEREYRNTVDRLRTFGPLVTYQHRPTVLIYEENCALAA